jgi:transcriptional regulator with GAF, ATPase, and Fis domain
MASPISSATQEEFLHQALEALERQMVQDALEEARFNQTQAAKLLGLNERMLR